MSHEERLGENAADTYAEKLPNIVLINQVVFAPSKPLTAWQPTTFAVKSVAIL